jgi:hypothetical protein
MVAANPGATKPGMTIVQGSDLAATANVLKKAVRGCKFAA